MPSPEPGGELLASQRVERPQAEPYERRIERDGTVWERSNRHASFRDGEMQIEAVPLEWREIAHVDADGVARIEAAVPPVLELPEEQSPSGTSAGGSIVTYTVALEGREHAVRLVNLTAADVPALAALDEAMQLAVAIALHPPE
jgi:hypothetical protein